MKFPPIFGQKSGFSRKNALFLKFSSKKFEDYNSLEQIEIMDSKVPTNDLGVDAKMSNYWFVENSNVDNPVLLDI